VADRCEHSNETSASIKGGEFLDWLSDFQLLKKDFVSIYEGVSKSFQTGRLERELQMVQLSATRCSCIAVL
jgi:hypothetical protein